MEESLEEKTWCVEIEDKMRMLETVYRNGEILHEIRQKESIIQNKMNKILKTNVDQLLIEVNRLHNRVCDIEKVIEKVVIK